MVTGLLLHPPESLRAGVGVEAEPFLAPWEDWGIRHPKHVPGSLASVPEGFLTQKELGSQQPFVLCLSKGGQLSRCAQAPGTVQEVPAPTGWPWSCAGWSGSHRAAALGEPP